eukprot:365099-Chlamydomonas_euryale.AAC.4
MHGAYPLTLCQRHARRLPSHAVPRACTALTLSLCAKGMHGAYPLTLCQGHARRVPSHSVPRACTALTLSLCASIPLVPPCLQQ